MTSTLVTRRWPAARMKSLSSLISASSSQMLISCRLSCPDSRITSRLRQKVSIRSTRLSNLMIRASSTTVVRETRLSMSVKSTSIGESFSASSWARGSALQSTKSLLACTRIPICASRDSLTPIIRSSLTTESRSSLCRRSVSSYADRK